jgi:ribonuclease HI
VGDLRPLGIGKTYSCLDAAPVSLELLFEREGTTRPPSSPCSAFSDFTNPLSITTLEMATITDVDDQLDVGSHDGYAYACECARRSGTFPVNHSQAFPSDAFEYARLSGTIPLLDPQTIPPNQDDFDELDIGSDAEYAYACECASQCGIISRPPDPPAFPLAFSPNNSTPEQLFQLESKVPPRVDDYSAVIYSEEKDQKVTITNTRFVRKTDPLEILIYVGGFQYRDSGAGCSVIFQPGGSFSFHLEKLGPDGIEHTPTQSRAKLRAVIAALQYRLWHVEGWKHLVIATDLEYIYRNAIQLEDLESNGWWTNVYYKASKVTDRDLWELLLKVTRRLAATGLTILFWKIPSDLNSDAHMAARRGAQKKLWEEFQEFHGTMVEGQMKTSPQEEGY